MLGRKPRKKEGLDAARRCRIAAFLTWGALTVLATEPHETPHARAASESLTEADQLLTLADEARDAGRFAEAAVLYDAALGCYRTAEQQDPSVLSEVIRFRMRYCEIQREAARSPRTVVGDPEDVRGLPEVTHHEPSRDRWLRSIREALSSGAAEQARVSLLKGLESQPDNVEIRLLLAVAECQLGRYDRARQILEVVTTEVPTNALAHMALGIALTGAGRLEDAVDSFRDALALDPFLPAAHYNLARVLLLISPPDVYGARRHYEKALRLGADPDPSLEHQLHGIREGERSVSHVNPEAARSVGQKAEENQPGSSRQGEKSDPPDGGVRGEESLACPAEEVRAEEKRESLDRQEVGKDQQDVSPGGGVKSAGAEDGVGDEKKNSAQGPGGQQFVHTGQDQEPGNR